MPGRSASNSGVLSPDPHQVPCPSEGVAILLGVGARVMHSVVIIAIIIHSFHIEMKDYSPVRDIDVNCSGDGHQVCGSTRREESTRWVWHTSWKKSLLSCVCKEEFARKKRVFQIEKTTYAKALR